MFLVLVINKSARARTLSTGLARPSGCDMSSLQIGAGVSAKSEGLYLGGAGWKAVAMAGGNFPAGIVASLTPARVSSNGECSLGMSGSALVGAGWPARRAGIPGYQVAVADSM